MRRGYWTCCIGENDLKHHVIKRHWVNKICWFSVPWPTPAPPINGSIPRYWKRVTEAESLAGGSSCFGNKTGEERTRSLLSKISIQKEVEECCFFHGNLPQWILCRFKAHLFFCAHMCLDILDLCSPFVTSIMEVMFCWHLSVCLFVF